MTSYVTTTHHRRTASLPRFDDGPQMARNGDAYVFKVNTPHVSRSSQMTSKGITDDYWSKKTLTTARSGEIVSGGGGGGTTPTRRPSERHYPRETAVLPPPSKTSTPNPNRTPDYRYSTTTKTSSTSKPLQKSSSFSAHGNRHLSADDHRSQHLLQLRSPFPRGGESSGGGGGGRLVDFDDGGLSNWEESFRKFNFGSSATNTATVAATSPGKLTATGDWKKEFMYGEEGRGGGRGGGGRGGGGGRSDLVYSKTTTTTRTRGGNNQPRNVVGAQRGYVSDSEDSWNWLEEQRAKLETKRQLQQQQHHASHEKLDWDERMNRQRSEVEGRLLNDLRSPQSTLSRHPPTAAAAESGSDLLRYRAKSMDNVGVDQDAYEVVSYSRFGPSVQRRTFGTLQGRTQRTAGGLSPPEEPPAHGAFGYGRRAYQTLPRDARLPGTLMPPRAPSSAGDQKTVQTFKNSETTRSTGSLNRRKSQEDRDEEITLRPIGPGVQPLESSVNSASTLSRIRLQHAPNADLETKPPPSIHLIPPTPGVASTFSNSSSSTIFRSNVRPETTASSGPGTSGHPQMTTMIATGSGPTRTSGGGGGNTLRFRNDEDGDMVVVEQAISPSQDRSYDGRPGSGSADQTVRRAGPGLPQPVRTVVVSPERPQFPSNGTPGFAAQGGFQQRQWMSNSDGVQSGSTAAWQGGHASVGGGDQRRVHGKNQSEDLEERRFGVRTTIQDGAKGMGVKVENDQRHNFSAQQQNLQASPDQQIQQLLMQQQQQLEQHIFEKQKQLEQQQQQLLEQQQQLQKQLEQHRLLQQQLSRAGQQQQQQQQAPSLQQSQQQWSYEKTSQQLQQPRTITFDQQQQFRGRQQEQQQQQQQQLGQQLQFDQPTYDLLPQQQQQQQLQNQQFIGQQQQQKQLMQRQQHVVDSQNFVQASDRRAQIVDDRGYKPPLQNSVAVQNSQATTFRGHGQNAESSPMSGTQQPLYQSVSEAHGGGESRVTTSPQYESPFSVFQSAGDPLSPTGASGPSVHSAVQRECRFEAVMPTYATPERTNHAFSSGGSDGKTITTQTTVRTNGTGFNAAAAAPGQDHRFHQIQRPGIVFPSPTNGTSPPGGGGTGDVRISPESYWIQNSSAAQRSVFEGPIRNEFGATAAAQVHDISGGRDPRKNISGTSSAESSLSPLSVDITRMKWTDAQGQSSPSFLADRSSGGSMSSSRDGALEPPNQMSIKFVKDASHLWYKPQLSREEVISSLKSRAVGSFLVRDSNTYPGSYALAVKVAAVPDNAPAKKFNEDPSEELVRHFLIESTPTGVRLKGYKSESVFGSLAALIYQHSITPLSLPCRLLLPASGNDSGEILLRTVETSPSADQLSLPSFNVLYIMSTGIELLSGPEAVDRAATAALEKASTLRTTVVSLKVAQNGVTITDNNRSLFFRQHFPAELIRYCGLDRRLRCWTHLNQQTGQITKNKIFGIISRRSGLSNECHLFAEMDSNLASSAGPIMNFINQIIPIRDRK